MTSRCGLLAICLLASIPCDALAQSQSESAWGRAADFKPLLPIIPPPLLPSNSAINPGSIGGDPYSGSSPNSAYDAARAAPAPGLRLTIPTR